MDIEQDIRGLEVAMQHTAFVRVMHGLGDGADQLGGSARCQRTALYQSRKILAFDVVHREVVLAPFVLPDLVNRDYVWVMEFSRGRRLSAKASHLGFGRGPASKNHFNSHDPVQANLVSPKNDAHSTACNQIKLIVIAKWCVISFWRRRKK